MWQDDLNLLLKNELFKVKYLTLESITFCSEIKLIDHNANIVGGWIYFKRHIENFNEHKTIEE